MSRDGFWASQNPVSQALPPTALQHTSPIRGHFLSGQFHCLRFRLLCSMLSLPTGSQPTRRHAEWRGQWKDTFNRVKAFAVYLLCPREKREVYEIYPVQEADRSWVFYSSMKNGGNENESIRELRPLSREKGTHPQCALLWQMNFSIRCRKQKNKSWPSFRVRERWTASWLLSSIFLRKTLCERGFNVCHGGKKKTNQNRVIQLYMREPTGWSNVILKARKTESNIYPNHPCSTPTFLPGCACYFIQTVHGYAVGFGLLSPPFCPASLHQQLPQAPDWISCSMRLLLSSWLELLTFRSPLTLFL